MRKGMPLSVPVDISDKLEAKATTKWKRMKAVGSEEEREVKRKKEKRLKGKKKGKGEKGSNERM